MVACAKELTRAAVLAALAVALTVGVGAQAPGAPGDRGPGQRIVSLVPALTEMLFAIGAGSQVVAVSSYDDFPPEVTALPKVGALLDPDVERILTLRPDLVLTYGSQSSLEAQLNRAGIRAFSYRHGGIQTILQTMTSLGVATGHQEAAARAAARMRAQIDAIRARLRGRAKPRVLLVFGREPRSLRQLYASGGSGFLHDVLDAAGGVNVFADVGRESVQPSQETLLALAPDVIVEIRSGRSAGTTDEAGERGAWAPLASIPAVRHGRIHALSGSHLVIPGPRVTVAIEQLARTLHPEAFK